MKKTTAPHVVSAAGTAMASELDYLRDYGNLDELTHDQIAEKLVARLFESGFKLG